MFLPVVSLTRLREGLACCDSGQHCEGSISTVSREALGELLVKSFAMAEDVNHDSVGLRDCDRLSRHRMQDFM